MIKLRTFTAQEQFALCRDFDGIYLLEMTALLWKLVNMLENSGDLNEELKEKIESLKGQVENETIELEEGSKAYNTLEKEITSFRNQKAFEVQLEIVLELKESIKEKFKMALYECIQVDNIARISRLCNVYNKVVFLFNLFERRVISLKAIMNLKKLSFDNEIIDNLIIQATMSNKEITSSEVYLKSKPSSDEECDFCILVKENEKYFMASYNSDGTIKHKEPVRLVPTKQDYIDGKAEVIESVIKDSNYSSYDSIDKILNEKNRLGFTLKFNTEKVINERTGTEYLIIGYYNWHELCLQDGILSIRIPKKTPDEKRIALSHEDSYILDTETIVKMVETQLSSLLSENESKIRQ